MNTLTLDLPQNKKIYFASDFHLGVPDRASSANREMLLVEWLDSIKADAHTIFLIGDVFDFWFEYKYTIPKGFIRFQGKLAELADAGIKFYFFPGNHDLWMFDYYEKELRATVSRKPMQFQINGKKFYIVHGDGYGPGDTTHKFILKIFQSKFFQWLFSVFPVDLTYWIANKWSRGSRAANNKKEEHFLNEDEWLWAYAKEVQQKEHHDFYIFGHRHLQLDLKVGDTSRYINLGEWVNSSPYGIFDGEHMTLKTFKSAKP